VLNENTWCIDIPSLSRKLHVHLAEAQAQAAAAESHETAIAEALKEAEDRHT
jgi:hypothetical protein